jgi:UDP-GlcNAc:undecaprenyl-phosphate GlcNAc-1-phosphate transferase
MNQNILDQLINNEYKHIIAFLCSFIITYFAIPVIVKISALKKLFDQPNGRTSHKHATSTLGGIAMFASIFISSMLFINMRNIPNFQYVIAGSMVMFFIGLKDDLIVISWSKKVTGELLAALFLIVLGDFRFTNLHGFLGVHEINYMVSIVITLVVMIGVVNAMNLIDGIDGLAAGLAAMASTCFGFWFYVDGQYDMMVIAASLSGTLLAFLGFNVFGTENKIFMGDTGSLLLGYLMTLFVIVFNESNIQQTALWHVHNAPIVSFAILFIPLFDTIRVMGVRIIHKKSPFEPDRTHIHHRLLDLGFSHLQTTLILLIINATFIMLIFMLQNLNIHILAVIVLAAGILKSYIPTYIAKIWLKRARKVVFTNQ